MVFEGTIHKNEVLFFREDFTSLTELTTFSMDGCDVEEQLGLGLDLFIENSDLQVVYFCHHLKKEQSFTGFGVSLPLPLLSPRLLPLPPLSADLPLLAWQQHLLLVPLPPQLHILTSTTH